MTKEKLYVDAWQSRAILVEKSRQLGTTPEMLGRSIGLSAWTVDAIVKGRFKQISYKTADRILTLRNLDPRRSG